MSRVVVITGASAGVGRATAIELARRGDRIALLARGLDKLEAELGPIDVWVNNAMTAVLAPVADT